MKDTSLDEFLSADETDERDEDAEPEGLNEAGDGDAETETATAESEPKEADEVSEAVETDIEPAVATSRWSPEGVVCDSCAEEANRLWENNGQYVCRTCVEW